MPVFLADARLALANMLGEEVVSTNWPASRDNAIQWSLERISRYYDFDFGVITTTPGTDTSGVAALTGYRQDPELDVRIVNTGAGNDFIFTPIPRADFDNYPPGSYRYYVSTTTAGVQTLQTTEASQTLTVTGSSAVPVLSAAVPSNFPSALAIAKGALIYIREFEDKDADTSVEDAKFQQIVGEIIGAEQRSRGPRRAIGIQEYMGHHTGEVNGYRYGNWGNH